MLSGVHAAVAAAAQSGAKQAHLDSNILHRSCIQLSSSLSKSSVSIEAEGAHLVQFVKAHAEEYPNEVVRAMVWRIVDTAENDTEDRLGAWELLHSVVLACNDINNDLSRTSIAEKISSFLPTLISYRWFTKAPSRLEVEQGGGSGVSGGPSASPAVASWNAAMVEQVKKKKVISAELMLSGGGGGGRRSSSTAASLSMEKSPLRYRYLRILEDWKKVWREDVYRMLRESVRRAEREGHAVLSDKAAALFKIPDRYKNSLWCLRRVEPRPNLAAHVLSCYRINKKDTNNNNSNNNEEEEGRGTNDNNNNNNNNTQRQAGSSSSLPASESELKTVLAPGAHPTVRAWISRMVAEKGGCSLCDSWKHLQSKCPCEAPFLRPSLLLRTERRSPSSQTVYMSAMERKIAEMPYIDAVAKLSKYGLALPVRAEKVLDTVVKRLENEENVDELLLAYDRVRGSITGPLERHALWIHASYRLLPSKTLFDRPTDDRLSPTLERVERLFVSARRYLEWDQLLDSVDVLDGVFRRCRVPDAMMACIDRIRNYDSFFFCLIDGSLPASYTPGKYARACEEVIEIGATRDVLCGCCLEPFHSMDRCPRPVEEREPWDLRIARQLLNAHRLLHIRLPDDLHLVQEAMQRIDADTRSAKQFRKDELALAIKLIHERRQPVCRHCRIVGHRTQHCEVTARRTLRHHNIDLVDARLEPHTVQHRIDEMNRRRVPKEEVDDLWDAMELLVKPHAYPPAYRHAIKEMKQSEIPLTAARYSTNAVQGFLLSIGASDLLQHLKPFREPRFPEVCIYCDSVHHRSEDCTEGTVKEAEVAFLRELRARGVDLWTYWQHCGAYTTLLPTRHDEGRQGVLGLIEQFSEDYGPEGIGRRRFMEANSLVPTADGSTILLTGETQRRLLPAPLSTASGPQGQEGQQQPLLLSAATLYGANGFSRLVEAEKSRKRGRWESEQAGEDAMDNDDNTNNNNSSIGVGDALNRFAYTAAVSL